MEQGTSVLLELRQATQALHDRLERVFPISALHADGGNAAFLPFLFYLQDFYGWLAPFEETLWSAPWPPEVQPSQRCGKLVWIESDLRRFGMPAKAMWALPRSTFRPNLHNLPARFGLAYVIEGAQLVQVLRKQLLSQLSEQHPGVVRSRWLQGYGVETSSGSSHLNLRFTLRRSLARARRQAQSGRFPRRALATPPSSARCQRKTKIGVWRTTRLWRSFIDALDRHLQSPPDLAVACLAARDAFDSLTCWCQSRQHACGLELPELKRPDCSGMQLAH